jgi:hypothetical protein
MVAKDNHDEGLSPQAADALRSSPNTSNKAADYPTLGKGKERRLLGPGMNSESPRMSTSFVTPKDSRSEAGNLLADQRLWQSTGTAMSSAGFSMTAVSTFGILGPKTYAYRELQEFMEFRLLKVLPERHPSSSVR